MSIKVIGAGFGRTGTLSLKYALEKLGFGRCYHMVELLRNPDQIQYWEDLEKGKGIDWEQLFTGYQSIVDLPGYRVYQKILQHYPDAKVILNTRSFDPWYESVYHTIFQAAPSLSQKIVMSLQMPFSPRLRKIVRVLKYADRVFWQGDFQGRFQDKEFTRKIYEKHHQDVIDHVPPDKLLVFEAKEGWDPLCRFLEVQKPKEPYPRLNERMNFKQHSKKLIQDPTWLDTQEALQRQQYNL